MRNHLRNAIALTILGAALGAAMPASAQNVRTEQVRFAQGMTGTSIRDTIRGDRIVDYVIRARAGQTLSVAMTTSNSANYFNVTAPGAAAAMHVGSSSGNSFLREIPSSGAYTIRVYLMRSAARRNESANYRIDFSVTGGGGGTAATGTDPQEACRAAVAGTTNANRVEVTGSEFSEAGTTVRLAVGRDLAPWKCIAYKDGSTAGIEFLGNDSAGVPTEKPGGDFADGNAGGPDFWRVIDAGTLNIRSGPATGDAIVTRVSRGAVLRNLGCRRVAGDRWCNVALANDGGVRGWASARYLAESGPPSSAGTDRPTGGNNRPKPPDYADGDAGGPDFWRIVGVAADDTLNIRSGPSTRDSIVTQLQNGTVVRNLGCQRRGNSRWCQVAMPHNGSVSGWANARYLAESGPPSATGSGSGGAGVGVPEIAIRATGEVEVRWSGGCTVLYDSSGSRIAAGSSCSRRQVAQSEDAIRRFRREQGL